MNRIKCHKTHTCMLIMMILLLGCETILAQLPRKIHCLDQTSTECYIVNTFLPKNNSYFRPVSVNPMNVISLHFESSNIPHITREICKAMPNLRSINAMKSMIEIIDEDSFAECTNLDFIDLSHNKISHLETNTFNRNGALKTLSLHDNSLTVLDVDLFRNLPNLWKLVLSMNEIMEVPVMLFRDLGNLGELALHHNRLIDLDAAQLIKFCPKLITIHLRDNDFRCERLQTILDILTKVNVNFWDYVDKVRPRNYTVEFIHRMECLSDDTFDMEMQKRKNLTGKISDMERELIVLRETVAHNIKERMSVGQLFIVLGGCVVLLVLGVIIGYFLAKRKRARLGALDMLNERMVGTDFSHDNL